MRLLKTIINFFKDFNQTKKDPFHSSKNSTYTLMRFLYKFLWFNFISNIKIFKNTKKPSNFNNGFKITALTKENTENLKRNFKNENKNY